MSQSHTQRTKTSMLTKIDQWSNDPSLTPEQRLAFVDSYVKVLRADPKRKPRRAKKAKAKEISLPNDF